MSKKLVKGGTCSFTIGDDSNANSHTSQVSPVCKSEQQPEAGAKCELSPSMTEEQFFTFLREEGLPDDDCRILRDTKIQAKTFIKDLSEDDIDNDDALGKFTFIGKRVLKRLLRQGSASTERNKDTKNSSSASAVQQSEIRMSETNMPTMGDEVMRNLFQKMALKTTRMEVMGLQEDELADAFQTSLLNAEVTPDVLKFEKSTPWKPAHRSLYIRASYIGILQIINKEPHHDFLIVGNPGTGKSYFAIYVLYDALQASKTVVFHKAAESAIYLFKKGQKARISFEGYCIIPELNTRETLYLYDAATKKTPKDVMTRNARLIVFSSPSRENIGEFAKWPDTITLNMPIWDRMELLIASKLEKYDGQITELDIDSLYEKFGGIAQYVLEVDKRRKDVNSSKLESIVQKCNLRMLNMVKHEDIDSESHMIFHRCTVPDTGYAKYTFDFASKYVGDKVFSTIQMNACEDMKAFVMADNLPAIVSSLRGFLFEKVIHIHLPEGGTYQVRNLSDGTETDVTIPKSNKRRFGPHIEDANIAHLPSLQYLLPIPQNFESVDALCPPNHLYQSTVSKGHTIKGHNLKNILTELKKHKDWEDSMRVKFYFVVPPDIYRFFHGKQKYVTLSGTEMKSTKDFDEVDQYVMNFDFNK